MGYWLDLGTNQWVTVYILSLVFSSLEKIPWPVFSILQQCEFFTILVWSCGKLASTLSWQKWRRFCTRGSSWQAESLVSNLTCMKNTVIQQLIVVFRAWLTASRACCTRRIQWAKLQSIFFVAWYLRPPSGHRAFCQKRVLRWGQLCRRVILHCRRTWSQEACLNAPPF